MNKIRIVQCASHGEQQETLVCQHILNGLNNKTRVGFFWTSDTPDNLRPDAWCSECEARVKNTNGEWIGKAMEHLEPKVLCGICYDIAKIFHMGGNPWS